MHRPSQICLALALPALLAGCNSGLAGLFASAEGSSSNAPSTVSAFALAGGRTSPAEVRFRLVDAEGDPARVTLFYQLDGAPARPITRPGGAANPDSYASSSDGVEQRRTIVSGRASDLSVELDPPLDKPLVSRRTWRVSLGRETYAATPAGAPQTSAWDSRDLPVGGEVLFRALPYDSELGAGGPADVCTHVMAGDLDGDGLLDLATANSSTFVRGEPHDGRVRLYFQDAPGVFSAQPTRRLDGVTASAAHVEDVDGDGELDSLLPGFAPARGQCTTSWGNE